MTALSSAHVSIYRPAASQTVSSENEARAFIQRGWLSGVGFVRDQGRLWISLPKVYEGREAVLTRNPAMLARHLFGLARVLARYRERSPNTNDIPGRQMGSLQESGSLLTMLDAASALYEDYVRHGLYHVRTTRHSRVTEGRVDWQRTVNQQIPVFEAGTVFYPEPIWTRRTRNPDDFLFRLHATVISEILGLLGDSTESPHASYIDAELLAAVKVSPDTYLRPYEATVYRDRGRDLLKLLTQYLMGGADNTEDRLLSDFEFAFVSDFEFVWEHMLREILGTRDHADRLLPSGIWSDLRTSQHMRGITPRIDFMRTVTFQGTNHTCVFDAKDKPVESAGLMSATENDVYKQIIYALLLPPRTHPILNVLVFPSLAPDLGAAEANALGSHVWQQLRMSRTYELSLDYEMVFSAFLRERSLDVDTILLPLVMHDLSIALDSQHANINADLSNPSY